MTRVIIVSLLLIALCAPGLAQQTPAGTAAPTVAAPATPPGTRVVLPGGTALTVVLTEKISSGNANVGDTFGIEAAQDVIIDGWLVIKKGAPGQGEILAVDRAGSHGHPGSLGVQMDWIYSVDGHKVKLTSQRKTEEGQGAAGAASTATILSYVFLGPLGLFAHNFVKGHDVVIDNTHPLPAYIDDSVYVLASERGEGPDSNFAQAVDAPPAQAAATVSAGAAQSVHVSATAAASTTTALPAPTLASNRADAPEDLSHQTATMPASQASTPTDTLLDVEGNQPKQTPKFAAPATWAIQYTFDCTASPKDTPTGFSVLVGGASSSIAPIIHAGDSGTDLVPVHAGGTAVVMSIQSHCIYHVRALAAAAPAI
jgi:hypothetical protein